jgi:hypothetical protein
LLFGTPLDAPVTGSSRPLILFVVKRRPSRCAAAWGMTFVHLRTLVGFCPKREPPAALHHISRLPSPACVLAARYGQGLSAQRWREKPGVGPVGLPYPVESPVLRQTLVRG